MDMLDTKLLDIVQGAFPLVARPFQAIGESLGIDEAEVIQRLQRLKDDGVLRRIGAVFSTENLELATMLVALKVPGDVEVETVAREINQYPEVTHNYARKHEYNLWFTVAAATGKRLDRILSEIRSLPGVDDLLEFPSRRTFKIDARFGTSTR